MLKNFRVKLCKKIFDFTVKIFRHSPLQTQLFFSLDLLRVATIHDWCEWVTYFRERRLTGCIMLFQEQYFPSSTWARRRLTARAFANGHLFLWRSQLSHYFFRSVLISVLERDPRCNFLKLNVINLARSSNSPSSSRLRLSTIDSQLTY